MLNSENEANYNKDFQLEGSGDSANYDDELGDDEDDSDYDIEQSGSGPVPPQFDDKPEPPMTNNKDDDQIVFDDKSTKENKDSVENTDQSGSGSGAFSSLHQVTSWHWILLICLALVHWSTHS